MEQFAVDIGGSAVHLRGPTGRDQLELSGRPGAIRRLVGRLLAGGARSVDELSVGERDRLVAALWTHCFGDGILASHVCAACGEAFDLSFSLAALVAALDAGERPDEVAEITAEGHARLRTEQTLRPVRGLDEAAVAALRPGEAAAALQARCIAGGGAVSEVGDALLERVLGWLDPVIDTDLDAVCPECGADNRIRFAIEHYFLTAMQGERGGVLRDVHVLASAYGWGLEEILGLSRRERRALAGHVEDAGAGSRGRAWA